MRSTGAGYGRYIAMALFSLMVCIALGGPISSARSGDYPRTFKELDGKRLGILVGTTLDTVIAEELDYTQPIYYDDYFVMERDLLDGELDAIVGDYPVLLQIAQETPGLRALDKKIEQGDYGMGVRPQETELHKRMNAILSRFKEDGTLKLLEEKWVFGPLTDKVMPAMDSSLPGEPLVMGTCCAMPPFSSLDSKARPTGFDIELVYLIAREMGRPLEIVNMDFGSLIPSLLQGEVIVIASCLSITPERQKVVRFSDSYFKSGVGAMVRK